MLDWFTKKLLELEPRLERTGKPPNYKHSKEAREILDLLKFAPKGAVEDVKGIFDGGSWIVPKKIDFSLKKYFL